MATGLTHIADVSYIVAFLYSGGPVPAECADFDGYDLITIRDALAGLTMTPPTCVNQPKIVAQPTSEYAIYFVDRVPSGVNSVSVFVLFGNKYASVSSRVKAFDLPLLVRIDGEIPQTLVASTVDSDWPGGGLSVSTDSALGAIIVSDLDGSVAQGSYKLFQFKAGITPSPVVRTLTLEYTELAPTMTGIFEPPNSACHYAMFLDQNLNAWLPVIRTYSISGDADNNGIVTISDCVFLINHIFAGGPPPVRVCQGDNDGNSIITISDCVYLIGYMFVGGPAPMGDC